MKLWDFFEQEGKKSKVSVNVKKRILKATGIKCFLCSWVWYSLRHVGNSESTIVRARMEYRNKGGFKVLKLLAGTYPIYLIITAGTDIHESILMQTVSTVMQ